jgi:predicted regulator of Ras-like GTPase activity (Roadblock/LC7/MglB family)
MHSVLQNLKSVSGVRGGLLFDDTGGIVANSLPESSGLVELQELVAELSYIIPGFQEATGGVKQFELRFEHARVIIRVFRKYCLLVLAGPGVNVQVLAIALNVAVNRLDRLLLQSPEPLQYLKAVVVAEPVKDLPILKLPRPQMRSEKMLERFNKDFSV